MTTELAPWLEYVERHDPELRARFRPADPERIAALERARGPLPAVQREFLDLVGGNAAGELAPLLANLDFDLGWLEQRSADAGAVRAIELGDQAGWSCLFRVRPPLNPAEYFLAPQAAQAAPCVVSASLHAHAPAHVHPRNATLLEYLLLDAHCFLRRARCEHTAVLIVNLAVPDEPRAQIRGRARRDMFRIIVDQLELPPVPGAERWWLGFERADAAMWCYVGPDGGDCEVALMADDERLFREYFHILEDNLELHRIR